MTQNGEQPGLPASYLLQLVALVERWGLTKADLFAGLPLDPKDLDDPDLMVSPSTSTAVIERARTLSREAALGFYLGLQMSICSHGYVSFATLSAPTLGEALALTVRYAPIRTTALALSLEVSDAQAALVVDERVDYGSARDVILLGLLVNIWHVGNLLLGREIRDTIIELSLSEPPWYARFKDQPPFVRFGRPRHRLVFAATLLGERLVSADPESLRLARAQCEGLLATWGSNERVVDRLRRMAVSADGGICSFDELAAAVHMSPRTLRRKLSQAGTSYSSVVEEERRSRAVLFLAAPELSIKEVAERLGYSTVANFIRAFRRWTGQTPAAFRRAPRTDQPRSPQRELRSEC